MKWLFIGILVFIICAGIYFLNFFFGPFDRGNSFRYNPSRAEEQPQNILYNKKILLIGSSVTLGMTSHFTSLAAYLSKRNHCTITMDAVLASTLAARNRLSYVDRLKKHTKDTDSIDFFLCQLSTNDAVFGSNLGKISTSYDPDKFNIETTAGGIEYIIHYVRSTWNCPVIFFTGTKFDNPRYQKMVNMLLDIAEKWDIEVIDLWHNEMNDIPKDLYRLYMHDGVHPTKAGYLLWWVPEIETQLRKILEKYQ